MQFTGRELGEDMEAPNGEGIGIQPLNIHTDQLHLKNVKFNDIDPRYVGSNPTHGTTFT